MNGLSKADQLDDEALDTMLQEMAETFPERPIYALSALEYWLDDGNAKLMQFLRERFGVPLTTLISRFIYLSWKGASVTTSICIPGDAYKASGRK